MGDLSWADIAQLGGTTLTDSQINSSIDYYKAAHQILNNTPPVITSSPETNLNQGDSFYYQIDAYDLDIYDLLTVSLETPSGSLPSWISYDSQNFILYGDAANEDVGEYRFSIVVADDKGGYDAQLFTLTVNNVNDAPVFDFAPPTFINEDTAFSFQLTATDIDSDIVDETLNYQQTSGPAWLTVSSTGLLSGTPTNDHIGGHQVTVQVTDSAGATDTRTFQLTVNNVNDTPVLLDVPTLIVDEQKEFNYQLQANDDDLGDELIYSAEQLPTWLDLSSAGLLYGKPGVSDIGTHLISVKVTDEAGASDFKEFNINVADVNDPPVFTANPPIIAREDDLYTFQFDVYDPDAEHSPSSLSFEVVQLPDWLTLSNDGLLSGKPEIADVGKHDVIVRVTDEAGGFAEKVLIYLSIT